MEEPAKVIQVLRNSVIVESQLKSACSQCQQVDNCGSGQVAKAFPQPKLTVEIETEEAYNVGDEVLISVPEHALLNIAWQVYLWPILGLMLAAGLGQLLIIEAWLTQEWQAIILGAIGGFLGYKLAKYNVNRCKHHQLLKPKITQRLIKTSFVEL